MQQALRQNETPVKRYGGVTTLRTLGQGNGAMLIAHDKFELCHMWLISILRI